MPIDAYRHTLRPGGPGAPLVLLLHGTGGHAADMIPLGASLLPGATLLAPEGDVLEGSAQRFFRRTAECVYDRDDLARAAAKMAGFARAHAQGLRPSAVLGLGISNGANILAATLFDEPALFDAAALMHPLIPFDPQIRGSLRAKPILLTAGRHDPICPAGLTNRLAARLEDAGAASTLLWHEGGHEVRKSELVAAQSFLARFATAVQEEPR